MTPFIQTLALIYLLYPLLRLLLVGLGIFIAKKNALLGNKRLMRYTIVIDKEFIKGNMPRVNSKIYTIVQVRRNK